MGRHALSATPNRRVGAVPNPGGAAMAGGEFTVCVYCSAHPAVPQSYLDLAGEVGEKIGARGWSLVWGGSRNSMMGVLARAVRANGGRTTGVIPDSLIARELADTDADELLVVPNVRERKAVMDAHADAFLALPGGLGTAEELFEVWTARYLRLHDRPVVLLDVDDHYKGLLEWAGELHRKGFVSDGGLASLTVAPDVDAALAALTPA